MTHAPVREPARRSHEDPPVSDWIRALAAQVASGRSAVLVSIVAVKGSVPRAAGTRMVVTGDDIYGTIGGGHLEHKAIGIARGLLAAGAAPALHRFPLGASLGQCCGGVALLLFEPVHESAAWLEAVAGLRTAGLDFALVTPLGPTRHGPTGRRRDDGARHAARCAMTTRPRRRPAMLAESGFGGSRRPAAPTRVFRHRAPADFAVVLFGAGQSAAPSCGHWRASTAASVGVRARAPFPHRFRTTSTA
jgi:xanthine dehydrogenase accessory factor